MKVFIVLGSVRVGTDGSTCDSSKVGAIRYRATSNDSYVESCMQDGASSYSWTIIKQNTW